MFLTAWHNMTPVRGVGHVTATFSNQYRPCRHVLLIFMLSCCSIILHLYAASLSTANISIRLASTTFTYTKTAAY